MQAILRLKNQQSTSVCAMSLGRSWLVYTSDVLSCLIGQWRAISLSIPMWDLVLLNLWILWHYFWILPAKTTHALSFYIFRVLLMQITERWFVSLSNENNIFFRTQNNRWVCVSCPKYDFGLRAWCLIFDVTQLFCLILLSSCWLLTLMSDYSGMCVKTNLSCCVCLKSTLQCIAIVKHTWVILLI